MGGGGLAGAGLVDVVLLVVAAVVAAAVVDLVDDEVRLEVLVVGVVTDEVLPAVAVVAGGATTVPLLRLTAPKALLTEANGGAIEDGDTALETVDDDGVGPPTNAAWPLVKGDEDPLTRFVAPAKEKLHISRGSKKFVCVNSIRKWCKQMQNCVCAKMTFFFKCVTITQVQLWS